MNGKFLLDTNFIIYALNAQLKLPSYHYYYSPITKIELLAYPKLTPQEHNAIMMLLNRMQMIDCDATVIDKTIAIRQTSGLKLPDSVVCASAMVAGAILVTNDDRLHRVTGLTAINYHTFSAL